MELDKSYLMTGGVTAHGSAGAKATMKTSNLGPSSEGPNHQHLRMAFDTPGQTLPPVTVMLKPTPN